MKALLARAEADHGIAGACIEGLFAGERETDAERYRFGVGAILIAKGLADLAVMRKAWSK